MTPQPSHLSKLSDAEREEVRRAVEQFLAASRGGSPIELGAVAAACTAAVRVPALVELVAADLSRRWGSEERPFVDEYLTKYPELSRSDGLPHLIATEIMLRFRHGDKPALSSYRLRFPELATTIERLVPTSGLFPQPASGASGPTEQRNGASGSTEQRNLASQYEKLELLGRGQFGEVWKSRAPGGVDVAMKLIPQAGDKDTSRRELQALELVKNLRHPHLLPIYAFWVDQTQVCIVMELADGTLRTRMDECRKQGHAGIPRDELIRYTGEAAKALDFLHQKNVFHRDVKPDNLVLVNAFCKLADFGLARLNPGEASMSFAGTPIYMAPELWAGRFTAESDQYSLACSYAELRQGSRPFRADDIPNLVSGDPPRVARLDGLPVGEQKVVRQALSKHPKDRFPSCVAFVRALITARNEAVAAKPGAASSIPLGSPADVARNVARSMGNSRLTPIPASPLPPVPRVSDIGGSIKAETPIPDRAPGTIHGGVAERRTPTGTIREGVEKRVPDHRRSPASPLPPRPVLPPRPMTPPPTDLATHPDYEVFEEIGRGMFTVVCRARNMRLRQDVAIKALLPEFRGDDFRALQLRDTVQFLAKLPDYDHIVRILDVVPTNDWLVLELMAGSLADKMSDEEAGLAPELVRSALRQALGGLQVLHEQGRYHGSLKPTNLLINDRGRVKLGDSPGLFADGVARPPEGPPKYFAPERIDPAFGDVGAETDLYSLGFTALELLHGPGFDDRFKGCGTDAVDPDVGWMRVHGSPTEDIPSAATLIPGLPEDLSLVLDRMLCKNVADRYRSAAEALRDLDAHAADVEIQLMSRADRVRATLAKNRDTIEWRDPERSPERKRSEPLRPRPESPKPPKPPKLPAPKSASWKRPDPHKLPLAEDLPDDDSDGAGRKRWGVYALLALVGLAVLGAAAYLMFIRKDEPETIKVYIDTEPHGARVTFLDPSNPDKPPSEKRTPNEYNLKPEPYTVRIEQDGYRTREEQIDPRQKTTFNFVLEPDPGTRVETISVELTTDPPGAKVYVNDTFAGTTPCPITLVRGVNTIVVKHPGYRDERREVVVDPAHPETARIPTISLNRTDSPPPQEVEVRIVVKPEDGFAVSISGVPRGPSPLKIKLLPGSHAVTAIKSGFKPVQQAIEVKAATPETFTLVAQRAETTPDSDEFTRKGLEAIAGGNWSGGLDLLVKGKHEQLRAAAEQDRAIPQSAEQRAALAGTWYGLARNPAGFPKLPPGKDEELRRRLLVRAWEWYTAALRPGQLPKANWDQKAEIEAQFPWLIDGPLEEYKRPADGVLISPDGKFLACCAADGSVHLHRLTWSPPRAEPLHTLDVRPGSVGIMVFTPNSKFLLTAGSDPMRPTGPAPIRVWDVASGKEVGKLEGHTVAVRGLAVRPDGKQVVSCGDDKTVRLWNLDTLKPERTLGTWAAKLDCVAFTPDGKKVIVGGIGPQNGLSDPEAVLVVFDIATDKVVARFTRHKWTVYCVVVTHDGKRAISAGRDGVRLWNVETGEELREFKGHTGSAYQVAFSPDERWAISCGYDRTVRLWNVEKGIEVRRFEGQVLVMKKETKGPDGLVIEYVVEVRNGHTNAVQGVCFSPSTAEGLFVFTACWDGKIRRFRVPELVNHNIVYPPLIPRPPTGLPKGVGRAEGADPLAGDLAALEEVFRQGAPVLRFLRREAPGKIDHWRLGAESGSTGGQILYAECLASGTGVSKDSEAAEWWLRQAVATNSPAAMVQLGRLFETGQAGLLKDDRAAAALYQKASDLGYARAAYDLGRMYEAGTGGLTQNDAKAFDLCRKAATGGYTVAMNALGARYSAGTGVDPDPVTAARWFLKSAEAGNADGMFEMARRYGRNNGGVAPSESEARRWFRAAAAAGHPGAMFELGRRAELGVGDERNMVEAVRWYRDGAELGDAPSEHAIRRLTVLAVPGTRVIYRIGMNGNASRVARFERGMSVWSSRLAAPPLMIRLTPDRQSLLAMTATGVNCLEPRTGKIRWQEKCVFRAVEELTDSAIVVLCATAMGVTRMKLNLADGKPLPR